jgi:hypothetical protein
MEKKEKNRVTTQIGIGYSEVLVTLLSEDGLTRTSWKFGSSNPQGIMTPRFSELEVRPSTRHKLWVCLRSKDFMYPKGGTAVYNQWTPSKKQRWSGTPTEPAPVAPPAVWKAAQEAHLAHWDQQREYVMRQWSDEARAKEVARFQYKEETQTRA